MKPGQIQLSTNPHYRMFIIDGTGAADAGQYKRDFRFSFLKQVSEQMVGRSDYSQGPRTDGQNTYDIAMKAVDAAREHKANYPDSDIYLAGYSRGGAAVMEVAKHLALHGRKTITGRGGVVVQTGPEVQAIPVKAMFLLDPVTKMDGCVGGVAENVEHCYVMYRDQKALQYDGQLKTEDFTAYIDKAAVLAFLYVDPDRYARKFMGNAPITPLGRKGATHFHMRGDGVITGASHGAIGGLPWPERLYDTGFAQTACDQFNGWLADFPIKARVSVTCPPGKDPPKTDEQILEIIEQANAKARGEYRRDQSIHRSPI